MATVVVILLFSLFNNIYRINLRILKLYLYNVFPKGKLKWGDDLEKKVDFE